MFCTFAVPDFGQRKLICVKERRVVRGRLATDEQLREAKPPLGVKERRVMRGWLATDEQLREAKPPLGVKERRVMRGWLATDEQLREAKPPFGGLRGIKKLINLTYESKTLEDNHSGGLYPRGSRRFPGLWSRRASRPRGPQALDRLLRSVGPCGLHAPL